MTDIPTGGPVDEPPPPDRFDPVEILRVLDEHHVRYVLIGGLAATLHGSPAATFDVDLAPAQDRENLTRLAAALGALGALRYTHPDEPLAPPGPEDFTHLVESFATPIGYVDVFREVRAVGDYARLLPRAQTKDVEGIQVVVANLEDIIASKRSANRPKDQAQMPALQALIDELGRGSSSAGT